MSEPFPPKPQESQARELEMVEFQGLFDQIREIHDAIAQRAYCLFEQSGRRDGSDLQHWLEAENEVLHSLAIELRETDKAFNLRAEVPGFRAQDLKLSIEPRRVAITGKREVREEKNAGHALLEERRSGQICRALELPLEVDPSRVRSALRDGVLELVLPKASRAQQTSIAARVA